MSYTPIPLTIAPAVPVAPTIDLSVPLDTLIEQYRIARDQKAELAAEAEKALEPVAKELARLSDLIMRTMAFTGQSSARTDNGTAYTVMKSSYSVQDPAELRAWVLEDPSRSALFANSLSKEAVEEYLAAGGAMPPGVKVSSVTSLRVNKPTK